MMVQVLELRVLELQVWGSSVCVRVGPFRTNNFGWEDLKEPGRRSDLGLRVYRVFSRYA